MGDLAPWICLSEIVPSPSYRKKGTANGRGGFLFRPMNHFSARDDRAKKVKGEARQEALLSRRTNETKPANRTTALLNAMAIWSWKHVYTGRNMPLHCGLHSNILYLAQIMKCRFPAWLTSILALLKRVAFRSNTILIQRTYVTFAKSDFFGPKKDPLVLILKIIGYCDNHLQWHVFPVVQCHCNRSSLYIEIELLTAVCNCNGNMPLSSRLDICCREFTARMAAALDGCGCSSVHCFRQVRLRPTENCLYSLPLAKSEVDQKNHKTWLAN